MREQHAAGVGEIHLEDAGPAGEPQQFVQMDESGDPDRGAALRVRKVEGHQQTREAFRQNLVADAHVGVARGGGDGLIRADPLPKGLLRDARALQISDVVDPGQFGSFSIDRHRHEHREFLEQIVEQLFAVHLLHRGVEKNPRVDRDSFPVAGQQRATLFGHAQGGHRRKIRDVGLLVVAEEVAHAEDDHARRRRNGEKEGDEDLQTNGKANSGFHWNLVLGAAPVIRRCD
jgi:hypothetical protein